MQSTPGTTSRVLSEIPISSPILAQSSVASTTPAKRGSGKSRGVIFAKVRASGKMPVSIPDGHRGTDGDESSRLATLIWNTDLKCSEFYISGSVYWYTTGGSRPFVWHRKKLQDAKGGTPTAADLYSKTHHKKNGEGWVSDVARENYFYDCRRRWWISNPNQLLSLEHQKMLTFLLKSLGKRSGYVRGLGRSVKPIAASSSTVSIQRDLELVRELEAAKATIEELKSRQSEYDNLKNQQEEMQEAQRQIQEQLQLLKAQFAQRDS
ncbi:hypothetical protein CJ030_MR0G006177 [Morella rubra]|uniref:Uncharacterized protein n=1 Tax=Morella rubra TaxID=262757 RepID=A0A6A1ULJ8_9ROSI|nr:hypothetical protein CJ030_MR0G006177 [Morella rubra]